MNIALRRLSRGWATGCLLGLVWVSEPAGGAPDSIRLLPPPPGTPGTIRDMRATPAGDLYCHIATNIWRLPIRDLSASWQRVALNPVLDLGENTGRELFARQDLGTTQAIYRLSGIHADLIARVSSDACSHWYVDAVGRVWCQSRERLLVVDGNSVLFETAGRQLGNRPHFNTPCEWRPGHVLLYYGLDTIRADSVGMAVEPLPSFFGDATGNGPFRLGPDHVVSGGYTPRGSMRLNMLHPDQPAERLPLGWDWFFGVATAPDGRLLVLAQTDHNPRFTLFWYGMDGRSQKRLDGAEDVIRASSNHRALTTSRLVFTTNCIGYTATANGSLAVFRPNDAMLLTPSRGLPVFPVRHLAASENDLILAGDGNLVLIRNPESLAAMTDEQFGALREWPLAGPCARDCHGDMWAFLLDFPGKLSRHDGERWQHFEADLENRRPITMTGDDCERLQVEFEDFPAGSALVTDGRWERWGDAHARAWREAAHAGATWFSDGSPFRPRHTAVGKDDRVWAYEGRILWADGYEFDYTGPFYNQFWNDTNGISYRGAPGRIWVYTNGCWIPGSSPPLSFGREGLAAANTPGRLPVVYDGRLKLTASNEVPGTARGTTGTLVLRGNEAFIPAPGGGWLGGNRLFRNVFYPLAGVVYPGTNGHYLVDGQTLRFQPPQTLTVEGKIVLEGTKRHLACQIAGMQPLFKPRLLVFVDGQFHAALDHPEGGALPDAPPGDHEIEVYAADGYGVVSEEPVRLAFEVGTEVAGEVRTEVDVEIVELDNAWTVKTQQWHALPVMVADRPILGRQMEIDADGIVWILTAKGVVGIDQVRGRLYCPRLPVRELAAACGRVWALGAHDGGDLRVKLYELRADKAVQAAELYDDSRYAHKQIFSDGGGIWGLSLRAAVRWDGEAVRVWERPLDFDAEVLKTPTGAIIRCREHYLVYRDGELGQPQPWTGELAEPVYVLGDHHLVMLARDANARSVIEVDGNRVRETGRPHVPGVLRSATTGDLYCWHDQRLDLLSGSDLTFTPLPGTPPPTHWGFEPGGHKFLVTTNGVMVYPVDQDRIVAGYVETGAATHGAEAGILGGETQAIRQAPDGRIWILRSGQLLVFDPRQPSAQASATSPPGAHKN